jgi:hypothetical protein
MTPLVRVTIFASALAMAGLGASSFAAADKLPRLCMDCNAGNNPRNVGSDQNQRNPGGRRRQIVMPEGAKALDQGYTTQLKVRSPKELGASDEGTDQGYPTRRKLLPEAQPGVGDNEPSPATPEQHVRKFYPADQPSVGGNGPDQGTVGRYVRKYLPADQAGVGSNGPDQGTPGRYVRKVHPDNQPSVGDNGPDQGTPDRYVRKVHPADQPSVSDNGPDQVTPDRYVRKVHPEDRLSVGDNQPDRGMPDPYVRKYPPDREIKRGGDGDVTTDRKWKHYAERKWRFDPNRHERRHHRDKRFHFFFGGYWYPEPYWDEFYGSYDGNYILSRTISCQEGAEIVAQRFYGVRILDCRGGVFTYVGLRYGAAFEIELSALTGTILNAHEI